MSKIVSQDTKTNREEKFGDWEKRKVLYKTEKTHKTQLITKLHMENLVQVKCS